MYENEELLYVIKPRFNFVYELGMPTGKKIRSSIVFIIILSIIAILINLNPNAFSFAEYNIMPGLDVIQILKITCYAAIGIFVIKLLFNIVFQALQYGSMSYKLYENYMIYEDTFLNQHKKNIQYSNIKEVEIRRTIWDRILGKGLIVIYTNAENEYSNGLIIYSINNVRKDYEMIDTLVNKSKYPNSSKENKKIIKDESNSEQEFKDSLNNIK